MRKCFKYIQYVYFIDIMGELVFFEYHCTSYEEVDIYMSKLFWLFHIDMRQYTTIWGCIHNSIQTSTNHSMIFGKLS